MSDGNFSELTPEQLSQLAGGQGGDAASHKEKEKQLQQQKDMKNSILSQILDQPARARLNTLALTKPEKAQQAENMLVMMARRGQISNKLGEAELKSLLEKFGQSTQKTTTVKYDRRRNALDDDSDDDL